MNKKNIPLMCLILCFVFVFSSCQKKYTVDDIIILESSGFSNVHFGNHEYNYEFWSYDAVANPPEPEANQTLTVTFDGKEYTGEYLWSSIHPYETYISDLYQGDEADFNIRRDTLEIKSITYHNVPRDTGRQLSADECRAIADEYVKQHIDLSEYRCTDKTDFPLDVYTFWYEKCCGDIPTNEYVAIYVYKGSGNIRSIGFHSRGLYTKEELEDNSQLIDLLYNGADEIIDKRVKEIYAEEEYFTEYSIKDKQLCKLDDGRLCVAYIIDVDIRKPLDSGYYEVSGDLITLLVTTKTE